MISEQELVKLSFTGAPEIITKIPGPEAMKVLADVPKYESLTRPGSNNPPVWDEGLGATVKDSDGNLFLDLTAGVAVSAVGRRHPLVIKAMEKQMGKIMHACEAVHSRRTELAKKISSIMPKGLRGKCVSYFTQSGSGAVETAIKYAHRATGKSQIVAFHGAYHGVWCGSGALTTGDGYRGYGPMMPYVIHVPYAYCYRCCFGLKYPSCDLQCAKYVDYVLNTPYTAADDVAAMIIEPQQGEGGYVIPPPGYLESLKAACEKKGILFIADEVQAGAGRSGRMWSIEHTDVVPDMLTWGKGMGGDLPMAGVTLRADIASKMPEASQPGTFAANALSSVVCMTNIDILTNEKDDLMGRTARLGAEVIAELQKGAQKTRIIGEVRGRGFFIGVELVKDKTTRKPLAWNTVSAILGDLLNRGVLVVPCGRYHNVIRFMPSLVITKEYLEKGVDILLDICRKY
ncbi:MAG TPA: aspartate aminotransferase family protein [Dehalococcoidales bacterium]|nr:aspartate aminotransferase family protein [Dehalococcoidales bacterium]